MNSTFNGRDFVKSISQVRVYYLYGTSYSTELQSMEKNTQPSNVTLPI